MTLERKIIDLGEVKAEISCILPSDICAVITSPEKYSGIKSFAPHIPYFAMFDKNRWYSKDGKITERGFKSIQESIKKTFNELNIFNEYKEEIKAFYENIPELRETKKEENTEFEIRRKLDEFVLQKLGIFMTYDSHELLIKILNG
jgi:hypothetical protein